MWFKKKKKIYIPDFEGEPKMGILAALAALSGFFVSLAASLIFWRRKK